MHVRTIGLAKIPQCYWNQTSWDSSSLDSILSPRLSVPVTAPPWIHANLSVCLSLVQSQLPSVVSSRNSLCSLFWCLVLTAPPWIHANLSVRLSPVQPQLSLGSSHQLLSWHQLSSAACLSLGRVVNSRSPPRTTSGYGEISCPRILCLVSRQNRLVCFGGLPP